MKKILVIFLLPFLLFACSDGGSDVNDSDTSPKITGVDFLVKTGSDYSTTDTFQAGNQMNAKIYASDSDQDMSVTEYTLYYPDDNTVLVGPLVEDMIPQTYKDMWYSSGSDMTIPDIQGEVKVVIKITDSAGQVSNTFVKYFTVE